MTDEQPKCEACGLQTISEYIRVRTTNGGLLLCTQCLDDINRKNPELQSLRRGLARVEGEWKALAERERKKSDFYRAGELSSDIWDEAADALNRLLNH